MSSLPFCESDGVRFYAKDSNKLVLVKRLKRKRNRKRFKQKALEAETEAIYTITLSYQGVGPDETWVILDFVDAPKEEEHLRNDQISFQVTNYTNECAPGARLKKYFYDVPSAQELKVVATDLSVKDTEVDAIPQAAPSKIQSLLCFWQQETRG